jgi:nucleoside-diphosphate-sugar epimerase
MHLEHAVTATPELEGVVLRYGFFYGPGTIFASDGTMYEDVKKRRVPLLGRARGRFSFVHVDDAVAVTLRAIEGGATGTFNVVEDEAPAANEWIPAYAAAIGARPPMRVPRWLGRLVAGAYAAYMMDALPAADNAKARAVFGWAPSRRWNDPPVLGGR